MKELNRVIRTIIITVCCFLTSFAAVSADCVCLDQKGTAYNPPAADSICYIFNADGTVSTKVYKDYCSPVTAVPVVTDKPVTAVPVVTDKPVTAVPVVTDTTVTAEPVVTDTTVTAEPVVTDTTVTAEPAVTDTTVTAEPVVTDTTVTAEPVVTDTTVTPEPVTKKAQVFAFFAKAAPDTDSSESPIPSETATEETPTASETSTEETPTASETATEETPTASETSTEETPTASETSTETPAPSVVSSIILGTPGAAESIVLPAAFAWSYQLSDGTTGPASFTIQFTDAAQTSLTPVTVDCVDGACTYILNDSGALSTENEITWTVTAVSGAETLNPASSTFTVSTVEPMASFSLMSASVILDGTLKSLTAISPNASAVDSTKAIDFSWGYELTALNGGKGQDFTLTIQNGTTVTASRSITASEGLGLCSSNAADAKLGSCSYLWKFDSELPGGTYTWFVSAKDVKGNSINSNQLSFTVASSIPTPTPEPVEKLPAPGKALLECPKGEYYQRGTGFYWAPTSNTESYTVTWWSDHHSGNLTLSNSDSTCQNNRCITYTTLPEDGNYHWYVTSKNKDKETRSDTLDFYIQPTITPPSASKPSNVTYSSTFASFVWYPGRDNQQYRLRVVNIDTGKIMIDNVYNSGDVCVDSTCSVSPGVYLPAGHYAWRVKARNQNAVSDWSNESRFTVECDYCNYNNTYYNSYANTIPTPTYPTGTIDTRSPVFTWRTLTGAQRYTLQVWGPNGKSILNTTVSSSNCTVEVCTYDPKITLTDAGNYTWKIVGGSNASDWGKANASFTLSAAPDIIQFVSPADNGSLSSEAPFVIWSDPGISIESFNVVIYNEASKKLFETTLTRESAWCDGTTCSIEFESIPKNKTYSLVITPVSTYGMTGESSTLHFTTGIVYSGLTLTSPIDNDLIDQKRPLFQWKLAVQKGTDTTLSVYSIHLTDGNQVETQFGPFQCNKDGLTCKDGDGFYSPENNLAAGDYQWQVIASNTTSDTAVSSLAGTFKIQ